MAERTHRYDVHVAWTGARGVGTRDYRSYGREHVVSAPGKATISGSSDPAFLGDPACWNPEALLIASLSTCHQLWYLHLCADAGVVVLAYADDAQGWMSETADGGRFTRVLLRPKVQLTAEADIERARALHHDAHRACFIASSVNFPVEVEPVFDVAG